MSGISIVPVERLELAFAPRPWPWKRDAVVTPTA